MLDIIRIGRIHTIDYENGTASVMYSDRNNQPSPQFPFFSAAYDMPQVDDMVVVLLLPNSTSKGFILGVPWSIKKKPSCGTAGVFYKEFPDGTYIKYNSKTKTMEISAPNVRFQSLVADNVTVKKKLVAEDISTKTLKAEKIEADTATIVNLNVTGEALGNFPAGKESAS